MYISDKDKQIPQFHSPGGGKSKVADKQKGGPDRRTGPRLEGRRGKGTRVAGSFQRPNKQCFFVVRAYTLLAYREPTSLQRVPTQHKSASRCPRGRLCGQMFSPRSVWQPRLENCNFSAQAQFRFPLCSTSENPTAVQRYGC